MKTITTGGFYSAYTDKYLVNTSEIKTEILRNLRYCDDYLSDVLYAIAKIDNHIAKKENHVEWIGYRKNGVDHEEYIASNLKDPCRRYYYYSKILRCEVSVAGDKMTVELKEVDASDFLKENGK